jgi:hypothetical protein
MTVTERINPSQLTTLPPEAGDVNAPRFEPHDGWLRHAPPEQQKMAMWLWFGTRYDDPAQAMPHDGAGQYLYTDGGPYLADRVLHERFDGCVAPTVVSELVRDVQAEVGNEWALKRLDKVSG